MVDACDACVITTRRSGLGAPLVARNNKSVPLIYGIQLIGRHADSFLKRYRKWRDMADPFNTPHTFKEYTYLVRYEYVTNTY